MLRDAIREIERAVQADEQARRRRVLARAELSRAEDYAAEVEELVVLERPAVPDTLMTEIRRFVRGHSRRLARCLAGEPAPARLLDVLFDVQERIQERMAERIARAA
jgi:hypothetical protein